MWAAIVAGAFMLNMYIVHKNAEKFVRTESEAFFDLLVTIRQWNSGHGLVYVPTSGDMQPNPYLIHNRRDAVTNFGDSLTMINPAFMTRQLSELAAADGVTRFHITSLNPIRPANKADGWETKALQTFKDKDNRVFEKIKTGDSLTFRFMAPLITEQSCLACHATQGYRLGDVRGGISINTAYHRDYAMASQGKTLTIYAVVFLAGFFPLLCFRLSHKRDISAKNRELQFLGTSKDKFFSVIAHDLKTPAGNIQMLSEMLQNQFDDIDNEERKSYIDMLAESARVHHDLLNTLLDLSMLQLGSKQNVPERLNIRILANDVLQQTRLQAQQKHIGLANLSDDCFARADRNMITTVVRNIVTNAIKFTNPEGQITISTAKGNGEITVSITDTGIGIADPVKNRVFAVDYHKSTAGTANEPGTGLGLILCKEYVERNGGRIWFESEPGKGTTFFFTLPEFED
jgi:signal transduction histidine kinase